MFVSLLSLTLAPATAETLTTSSTCSSPIGFVLDEPVRDPDSRDQVRAWLDAILSGGDRGKLGIKVDYMCCPSGQSAYAVDAFTIFMLRGGRYEEGEIRSAWCE